jgi:hypothetical protein
MKKLFFSVLAFTIGAFAFVSCDKDDAIDNDEKSQLKSGYLTVEEQQAIISSSLSGIAESVDFTDFSAAAGVITGILNKNYTYETLSSLAQDSDFAEDTVLLNKVAKAYTMFRGDSIYLDLTSLYLSADIYLIDTLLDSDTTVFANIENVNHKSDCIDLNVYVDGHKIELKAKAKANKESFLTIVNNEEGVRDIFFPESVSATVLLDGKSILEMGGGFNSDMNIVVVEANYEEEEGTHISYDGNKISVKGNLTITGFRLDGSFNLDMEKGADLGLKLSIAGQEAISLTAKVDAVFADLDTSEDSLILKWAQDPDELKAISLTASIGGDQVTLKGSLDSPFKDRELAASLRYLMNPETTLTEEQSEAVVAKLNEILDVELYFEGYKNPQAKLQFISYNTGVKGADGDYDDDDDDSVFDDIFELFERTGAYPVIIAHDKDGNEVTVSIIEYVSKIDLSFVDVLSDKIQKAIGPVIEELAPLFNKGDKEDRY